jgi:hypothetical protein
MPSLEDIEYSRDETVAAVRDYYQFLTKMYLDEAYIIESPPAGWPDITNRSFTLDKSNSVIDLLRHLPYIKNTSNPGVDAEGAPDCEFADWQSIFQSGADRSKVRVGTEDISILDSIPKHVIGLTFGGSHNPTFLLDVKLGTILWYECPGGIRDDPIHEEIEDDPYDYCCDDEEAEWRAEGTTWAIPDFFAELKDHFRRLDFVPLSSKRVVDVWTRGRPDYEAMLTGVQDIYRQHGWPNLDNYDKTACLTTVTKFIEEQYPEA